MIKILYWNVQDFAISKIHDTRPVKRIRDENDRQYQARQQRAMSNSKDRLDIILDTMRQGDGAMLDIFVLVENVAGGDTTGSLITGSGVQGATDLLEAIRARLTFGTRQDQWMLVPPLLLTSGGTKEGISVFFNSATLDFTGPYGWGGQVAKADGDFVNYGKTDFKNALPTAKVSDKAGFNAGKPQNTLAGQVTFFDGEDDPIGFPVRSKDRAPLLTTFWHKSESKNIKLLSYHAPNPDDGPSAGIIQLANIPEMTTGLGDNEIGVIVGDFNVNVYDNETAAYAYGPLTTKAPKGQQYIKHINASGLTTFPSKGYLCTTMYATNLSSTRPAPWGNWADDIGFGYPGYDYTTENSYDNILTRYGKNMTAPDNSKITIVNRVTGTPYNGLDPSTDGAPIGSFLYTSSMDDRDQDAVIFKPALPLPPKNPGPEKQGGYDMNADNAPALRTKFIMWGNYGKIRSTSDHLPLLIQV